MRLKSLFLLSLLASVFMTLPLLCDFISWFSWQAYLFVLWGILVLAVAFVYGVWWLGLSFLGVRGRLVVGGLWSLVWFSFASWGWCEVCGGDEGLFVLHPLLFLVGFEWMRALIYLLTWEGVSFLIFSGLMVGEYVVRERHFVGGLFMLMSALILVVVVQQWWSSCDWQPPSLVVDAPRIPFYYERSPGLLASCQRLVRSMKGVAQGYVVLPESAVQGCLLEDSRLIALWEASSVGRVVLFGGRVNEGNAVFCFIDGTLVGWRVKSQAMPFFERLPPGLSFLEPWFEHVFGAPPFVRGQGDGNGEWAVNGQAFTALLCSEFFFTSVLGNISRDTFLFTLINDGWFCHSYGGFVLWCMAAVKALKYHRLIGYVSYSYAGMFDGLGRWREW